MIVCTAAAGDGATHFPIPKLLPAHHRWIPACRRWVKRALSGATLMIVTKQSLATLEAWKYLALHLQANIVHSPSRFPVPGIAAGHQVLARCLCLPPTVQ